MIKGLGTALITPFKADQSVDYEALARLLDTQLTGYVDYLVVLGTTGEAATMTAEEKREVRRFIVDYVRNHPVSSLEGRSGGVLPLVLGVGGNNTAQVISDLKAMKDELILDFTAILSVCPYYNKPNQEGLFQHFCAIAEASPIPVILYNVPGRTGVNLLPETVMRIYHAHPDKIAGIKEASGNLDQIKHLISLSGEAGLSVISGDDGIACDVMAALHQMHSLRTFGISCMTKTRNSKPDTHRWSNCSLPKATLWASKPCWRKKASSRTTSAFRSFPQARNWRTK